MEKVKEDVHISVNEKGSIHSVRDIDYPLSLGESTEQTIVTEMIIGEIDSLIISCNKKCEILLVFFERPDIIVYHNMEFNGTKYVPLRLQGITPDNQLLLPAFATMLLNNRLRLTIRGQAQTQVDFTLRMRNG